MDAANLNLFEVEEEDDGGSSGGVIWCPHAILDDDGKLCWSGRRYATGCCSQTITVFQRQAMLTSRSPTVRARMGRAIFQGFLLGTMFYQLGKSQGSADNRFGALFISLTAIVMGSVSTIPELYSQRRVFYQEKRAGYFRPIVWQLSLVLTELPLCAIEMTCYSTLFYGLVSPLPLFFTFFTPSI